MYDVICVGSATVDVFAHTESELIKIKTKYMEEELIAYPSGSKILIKHLSFETGGGGTNTAVAFARLGLKTGYLGKIGNDINANRILEMLKSENIDFVGAKGKGASGYSVILKNIEEDRSILTHKGINNDLEFDEVDPANLDTKWFYFSSMVGKSYETLEAIAVFAKKNGIRIAFNPSNYLAEKGQLYLQEILTRTDVLVLNKEEAQLLVGTWPMKEMLLKLQDIGPEQVVVTDGKNGAFTLSKKYIYRAIPNKVNPVEKTGAGDSFAATYIAGLIKGKGIEYCLSSAQINSESVIKYIGAKNKLLNSKKIDSLIKQSRITVERHAI